MLEIRRAESPEQLAAARTLIREYSESLGIDLAYDSLEEELATLPGAFAPPGGRLLLASHSGGYVGCGALRDLGNGICEMKRLYVRPAARGLGAGRALSIALLEEARQIGYRRMRLDTLPHLDAALALYRDLGFRPIPPYRDNPNPGVVFLELAL